MGKEFRIGKEKKSERITLFIGIIIFFYAMILFRLFYMQVFEEERYK